MSQTLTLPPAVDMVEVNRIYRKIAWRILPILFISYCVAVLDRVNVGFTQLQMGEALGIGPAQYGFAADIFFLSYALCEMPSNSLFARLGARKTFLRIMVLWGLVVVATAFAKTPTQFYVLRLLLGVFEAGFFPGMILYLTYWFPSSLRARVTAVVALANAFAGTIAGPLTAATMTWFDGSLGWQDGSGFLSYRVYPRASSASPAILFLLTAQTARTGLRHKRSSFLPNCVAEMLRRRSRPRRLSSGYSRTRQSTS
jgi:sugar phosphate permease